MIGVASGTEHMVARARDLSRTSSQCPSGPLARHIGQQSMGFLPEEPEPETGSDWSSSWARAALESWQRLLPQWTARRVPIRCQVFRQGVRAENVHLLSSGLIKLVTILKGGTEVIVDLRTPGQIVDSRCIQEPPVPLPTSAVAVLDSDVLQMPVAVFARQLQIEQVRVAVLGNLLRDLTLQYGEATRLKSLDPLSRMELVIDRIACAVGVPASPGYLRFLNPLTDEELAQALGVSVRHLRRLRRELKTSGRVRELSRRCFVLPMRLQAR